jgi:hypothetical protein
LGLHRKGELDMADYLTPDFKGFSAPQGLRLESR